VSIFVNFIVVTHVFLYYLINRKSTLSKIKKANISAVLSNVLWIIVIHLLISVLPLISSDFHKEVVLNSIPSIYLVGGLFMLGYLILINLGFWIIKAIH
jgi:uncharacterized membrane protein